MKSGDEGFLAMGATAKEPYGDLLWEDAMAEVRSRWARWEEREREAVLARMELGWRRSLERLQSEVAKLRNTRIPHGRSRNRDND